MSDHVWSEPRGRQAPLRWEQDCVRLHRCPYLLVFEVERELVVRSGGVWAGSGPFAPLHSHGRGGVVQAGFLPRAPPGPRALLLLRSAGRGTRAILRLPLALVLPCLPRGRARRVGVAVERRKLSVRLHPPTTVPSLPSAASGLGRLCCVGGVGGGGAVPSSRALVHLQTRHGIHFQSAQTVATSDRRCDRRRLTLNRDTQERGHNHAFAACRHRQAKRTFGHQGDLWHHRCRDVRWRPSLLDVTLKWMCDCTAVNCKSFHEGLLHRLMVANCSWVSTLILPKLIYYEIYSTPNTVLSIAVNQSEKKFCNIFENPH